MVKKVTLAGELHDTKSPDYHLVSLNNRIREMMNFVLRPHELKHVEWRLLNSLSQVTQLTICDLAELAVIERTVTSRLVDKMIARKLLKRLSHNMTGGSLRFLLLRKAIHSLPPVRPTYQPLAWGF